MSVQIEFCGEVQTVREGTPFLIGREGDLVVDDNPFLHRTFLSITQEGGLWWLSNIGNALSATVTDTTGNVQAWLAPGARLPIVFPELQVLFSAGTTTYDFTISSDREYFTPSQFATTDAGTTTVGPIHLTSSQRLLIVALAEQVLRQSSPGRGEIPASAAAAKRLGWSQTTFNRKLDNVCDKLDKFGVQGLRGGPGKLATGRRARLVEYAVSTRLVDVNDLPLLDREQSASAIQPGTAI
ncbi:hypothetical protein ACL9RL_03045 [Plantibacter sp. Mn2098]|uniref:hypothetical protein n=1 Tax=Plantibacter sp. Mn2098 TaxID=3395266 RepID=UPI003BCBFD21